MGLHSDVSIPRWFRAWMERYTSEAHCSQEIVPGGFLIQRPFLSNAFSF